jgi:hypothetical protein
MKVSNMKFHISPSVAVLIHLEGQTDRRTRRRRKRLFTPRLTRMKYTVKHQTVIPVDIRIWNFKMRVYSAGCTKLLEF